MCYIVIVKINIAVNITNLTHDIIEFELETNKSLYDLVISSDFSDAYDVLYGIGLDKKLSDRVIGLIKHLIKHQCN